MPSRLEESQAMLQQALGNSDDILFQRFTARHEEREALLVYIDGLTSTDTLQSHVLKPLMTNKPAGWMPQGLADWGQTLVTTARQRVTTDVTQIRKQVYRGKAALLIDGYAGAIVLGAQGWEERPVQSPPTESTIRGPRDGFIENITSNVALIRRRLCDPALRVKFFSVGTRSQSKVALVFLCDVARPQLVTDMEARLSSIEFDSILDANQLRELVVGQGFSPFPKMESTERPDKVVAALLSGKTAVLVDNSPFVLTAPTTLIDSLWAPDDYYSSPAVTVLVRTARVTGWLTAVILPPLYVATQMYNPDILRTDLALFLAEERGGVPLTAALEIVFLEIMMEMIHEATIRLPAKVGSAATIVGGLIVGQASVQAGLLSGVVVVVVAISAIGSFTMPSQEMAQIWRAIKWGMIIVSASFGVYGIFTAGLVLIVWLNSQDSFGTPYLTPVSPLIPGDLWRDSLIRMPWDMLHKRPATYRPVDTDRTPKKQRKKYKDGRVK